VIVEEET